MSTSHGWFRSGAYSLLGHIDFPETACAPTGVLIVPPFGWEDVCSYRPLRSLGRTLAASGIPVLRYDLPGTGDSSGDALDSGLFEAWIQSVDDAASQLRDATGVENVAVVGIRLGAMLAVSAAGRGSNLQDLVLWGPAATGRAMLRELRAFSNMERREYANGDSTPPQPIPGLEIGGFLIAPQTRRILETLDLSALPRMQGRRVLFLSRDDLAPDRRLIRALRSAGCTVEVGTGSGYAAMMAVPHEAIPPEATGRAIVEFLTQGTPQKRNDRTTDSSARSTRTVESAGQAISETIYTLKRSSDSIFGILSEPLRKTQHAEWCVLFLNAGAVRHTGPNRMWVEAARRWATQGVASLRLDLTCTGESDGEYTLGTENLYQDQLVDQIETAMDSLRARLGVRRFAAVGLCSGAFWAFHAAVRRPDLRAAILLNPRLFFWDPEVDRRRLLRRTVKGLTEWADWRRLARGEVPIESIKQVARMALDRVQAPDARGPLQIPPEAMAEAWAAIERSQSRVTLIFTEGEPLLREMEEEGQMPPETSTRVRCVRVANAGHTFRALWAQLSAHEIIDGELRTVLHEKQPDSDCVDWGKQYAARESWL
ncbi:MAG: hypothetical protein JWO19_3983 [Bryobacterales bacterium]|nr:hypothetical protein [Bryobacterales bacterium]